MDKQTAKRVTEFVLKASGELDESVAFVRQYCSESEFEAYRESISKVMNDLWVEVLSPAYRDHPDLEPAELKQ